ncbi:unnamed protein product [Lota lota]
MRSPIILSMTPPQTCKTIAPPSQECPVATQVGDSVAQPKVGERLSPPPPPPPHTHTDTDPALPSHHHSRPILKQLSPASFSPCCRCHGELKLTDGLQQMAHGH